MHRRDILTPSVVISCLFLLTTLTTGVVGGSLPVENGGKSPIDGLVATDFSSTDRPFAQVTSQPLTASINHLVVTDQGDDIYRPGEQLLISPEAVNDGSTTTDIRTTITVNDNTRLRGPLTVEAGDSQWYGRTFTPPAAGEYNVTVRAQVADGSTWRTTDTVTRTITVESQRSAHIETVTVMGQGDTVRPGEQLTISPEVVNDGATTSDLRTTISVAGDTKVRGPLTVEAGDSQWYGRTFTPATSGQYNVTVRAQVADGSTWRTTDTVTRTVTVNSSSTMAHSKSVYVWGYAWTLVGNDDAAARFFETADEENITTVYLSGGVVRSTSDRALAQFIQKAHEQGLSVEALAGATEREGISTAERMSADVVSYNEGHEAAAQFDGIHLDVEPAGADLQQFLTEYAAMLDRLPQVSGESETVASQSLTVSASVGPYWSYSHPTLAKAIVDHPTMDYVSVMAYTDTESQVRDQVSSIMSGTDTPYRLAIETQEFTQPTRYTTASHYESGPRSVTALRRAIATDPPVEGYTGTALHFYSSSVSTWHALQDADVGVSSLQRGDALSVSASVLFDDNFPQSAHRSKVLVRVEGNGETYRGETTTEPPSRQAVTPTVQVPIPESASPGEYTVTVALLDTTYEGSDREATGTRDTPVEIGETTAGTITIKAD